MARTNIVPQVNVPIGSYPTLPLSAGFADLSLTSTSDPTDRSTPLVDRKTMVLAYNSDSSAHTITFTSATDTLNRKGDIAAYSMAALKISVFGPFQNIGWQTGGLLLIDVSDPKVQLAVITLP